MEKTNLALNKKAKTKLGALASEAEKTVHDLIRERGGTAKNARKPATGSIGLWPKLPKPQRRVTRRRRRRSNW